MNKRGVDRITYSPPADQRDTEAVPNFRTLMPAQIRENIDAFLAIASDVPGEYWGLEHFLAELPDKWRFSFAVWLAGRPIGYAVLSRLSGDGAHLHHFMIERGWRGRRLGARMIQEMERRVMAAGITMLSLKVHRSNLQAHRFYESNGYKDADTDGAYRVLRKHLARDGSPTVAIHQPNYMPWLGYFYKMARADVFVLLDDAQFSKNSVINRVRVLKDGAPRWLTVPVRVHLGQAINTVVPAAADWARRHLDALRQFYTGATQFKAVWPEIEAIYLGAPDADLAVINRHMIAGLANRLGIKTRIASASDFNTGTAQGTDRLVAITQAVASGGTYLSGKGGAKYQDERAFADAGLTLRYTDFEHPRYDQGRPGFVEGLSVLDAVFHTGWDATSAMVGGA